RGVVLLDEDGERLEVLHQTANPSTLPFGRGPSRQKPDRLDGFPCPSWRPWRPWRHGDQCVPQSAKRTTTLLPRPDHPRHAHPERPGDEAKGERRDDVADESPHPAVLEHAHALEVERRVRREPAAQA